MVDAAVSVSESQLNGCQIFGWFLKSESEQNFGFPHIPIYYNMQFSSSYLFKVSCGWLLGCGIGEWSHQG